jgi:hypothetical protein
VNKLVILFGFLVSMSAVAHMDGDTIVPLGATSTEEQKKVIRDGAQDFCDGAEEDAKEECVMDFFANHNLEEEPSCD